MGFSGACEVHAFGMRQPFPFPKGTDEGVLIRHK